MALLNGIYIFVETEDNSSSVEVSEHPVEKGMDITDNVRANAETISLSGEIVGDNYLSELNRLKAIQKSGKIVKYSGCKVFDNCIIRNISTSNKASIHGGCAIDVELQEIRIAKQAYLDPKKTLNGTQQVQKNGNAQKYTVVTGDCLWNLAIRFYGNGASYTKIYEANKNIISNPALIYPGQILDIPA